MADVEQVQAALDKDFKTPIEEVQRDMPSVMKDAASAQSSEEAQHVADRMKASVKTIFDPRNLAAQTVKQYARELVQAGVCGDQALIDHPENAGSCLHQDMKNALAAVTLQLPHQAGEIVCGAGYDLTGRLVPGTTPKGAYAGCSVKISLGD